jgi:hypothetical protein
MTIADLQSFLRSLAPVLSSAGGSKVAGDLERLANGLATFQSLTIAQFVDFLVRAEDYARTGIVPVQGGRSRKPAKPSGAAVAEAARLVKSLYEQALQPSFRLDEVDRELRVLAKLKVEELKLVAKELNMAALPRKKADILADIGRKIKGRREFLDRSETASIRAASVE